MPANPLNTDDFGGALHDLSLVDDVDRLGCASRFRYLPGLRSHSDLFAQLAHLQHHAELRCLALRDLHGLRLATEIRF